MFLEFINYNSHSFFTSFLCFLNGYLLYQLNVYFHQLQTNPKKTYWFGFSLLIYTFINNQLLQTPWYELAIIFILAIGLCYFEKLQIWKSLLSSVIVVLMIKMGAFLLVQPLSLHFNFIFTWTTESQLLAELIISANFLFGFYCLEKSKSRFKTSQFIIIFAKVSFVTLTFFQFYYLIMLCFWSYANHTAYSELIIRYCSLIILFSLCIFGLWYIIKEYQKKHFEETQLKTNFDQSYQLTETLFSERREYRNQLQVINFMATINNNIEIKEYIYRIIENMSVTSLSNITNPILRSAIMTRQIQAKEQGVSIIIQCNSQLPDIPFNILKLTKILEILLDIFVKTELSSKSLAQSVFLNIDEYQNEFFFELKSSFFSISQLNNPLNLSTQQSLTNSETQIWKIEEAIRLIQEMKGDPCYSIQNNHLVCFHWIIKKPKTKILGLAQLLATIW